MRPPRPILRVFLLSTALLVANCSSSGSPQEILKRTKDAVMAAKGLPQIPTLESLLTGKAPVTTSFADAQTEAPLLDAAFPESIRGFPLSEIPRDQQGRYLLAPGLYEMDAESYCIRAGTHGPATGDGYLYAPLQGPRAGVVQSILRRSREQPDISQRQVQLLLWAVIARTKFRDMSGDLQRAALALLNTKEIFELNGGALGLIPEDALRKATAKLPPEIQRIYAAEHKIRLAFTSRADSTYEEIEQLAVLTGAAPVETMIRPTPRGRWSYHSDGYFIRFFPSGYQRTRFQVYVPPSIQVERDEAGRITGVDDGRLFRVETSYRTSAAKAESRSGKAQAFQEFRLIARRAGPKASDMRLVRKSTAESGASLADYTKALQAELSRQSFKETKDARVAGMALSFLDRAVEAGLYMELSGRVADQGRWATKSSGADTGKPLVEFDPTENVAVPANTSSQRLVSAGEPYGEPLGTWHEDLPDCPCSWKSIPLGKPSRDKKGRTGTWEENTPWQIFHPGAEREARWIPDIGGHGQQCTYARGQLITGGLAAGTPDFYNSDDTYRHVRDDVYGFGGFFGRFMTYGDYPCDLYFRLYPPNQGQGCKAQIVTPFSSERAQILSCRDLADEIDG